MVKKKSIFPLTKLSDVVSMKSGESITAERITSEGKFPCFGGNGLRGYTTTFTHDGSYALVGRQGALCGNVTFVSGRFYASEHAIVVTPKKDTDIKFMSYVLYDMNLNQYSESSAQPGLSVKKLLELEYPIPKNKEEQTAIAEALSNIDSLISSLQKLMEKKKAIKQGAMQELLTGKKRLPGFSGEWSNLRIEEIANLHDNLRVPVEKSMRKKGNIPYYGANGIQDYVNGYTHNGSYVLIAEDGANDLQEYPIRYASGKIWVNNHVHVLDGKNSVSDTRFLSYSMSTIDYQAAITGGTRAKLNGHILMQLSLDLPPVCFIIKCSCAFTAIRFTKKLFYCITKEESPFTPNTTKCIDKIAISCFLFSICPLYPYYHFSVLTIIAGVFAVLILRSISLIFKYGCSLQKEIDETL